MKTQQELFEFLYEKNVNNYTEKKNDLTYLSWVYAWKEMKVADPDAEYEIKKFVQPNGTILPYMYDERTGYMVMTQVTACGKTYEMWLPVMDNANNAMKSAPYTYKVKKYEWDEEKRRKVFQGNYEEKEVEAATMFDVNKAIMRCLVKNLAMFGLGLYIYAGEDLPEEIEKPCTEEQIKEMEKLGVKLEGIKKKFKVEGLEQLTKAQAEFVINAKKNAEKKGE